MIVEIKGARGKKVASSLEDACRYFMYLLMPPKIQPYLSIYIILENLPIDGLTEGVDISGPSRLYNIYINKRCSAEEKLIVLAHECIHIKQLAMGDWQQLPQKHTALPRHVWYGETVDEEEEPWELEAYMWEDDLVRLYHERGNVHSIDEDNR